MTAGDPGSGERAGRRGRAEPPLTPLAPRLAASFSIFRPSSYHLVVNTAFGLRLQVQLLPLMQLFLTLDQDAQGQVQGEWASRFRHRGRPQARL